MREYEITFIVQPEISEEGREALVGRLGSLLEKGGATRLELHDHGKRKLAYEIRKFQKGHYLTLNFLDQGPAIPELERALRVDESVLRYLTVQVSEEIQDVGGRRAHAAEQERIRKERAAERAAREAEERAAREAEERERAAQAAAQGEAGAGEEQPAAEEPESDEGEDSDAEAVEE